MSYTNIGPNLWTWEPFRRLERHHEDVVGRCAKLFWLALYTTPEAKLVVPGMFVGSVTTMAEAARMPVDACRTYLDRLLEDDLVEYDIDNRVLRMTALPDAGESPSNGRAIRGWWRKFQTVPACPTRDAHVTVLRWILDEYCRTSQKVLSKDHTEAWNDTFARLPMPALRRRVSRHVQTDLFDASSRTGSASGSPKHKINTLDTNNNGTTVPLDPDPDQDQDLRDQREGGSGGGHAARKRAVLTHEPHPAFDADVLAEMLHKATSGEFPAALTKAQRVALGRAIDACGDMTVHPAALAALGEYVASLESMRSGVGLRGMVSLELVTSPGWIGSAIRRGLEWQLADHAAAHPDPEA